MCLIRVSNKKTLYHINSFYWIIPKFRIADSCKSEKLKLSGWLLPAPVLCNFNASMRMCMRVCTYVCTRAPIFCVYSDPMSEKERKIRDSLLVIFSLSFAFTASAATVVSYYLANAGDAKSLRLTLLLTRTLLLIY